MPATATGRGAQVILDGDAQKAARGAFGNSYAANAMYLDSLQRSGVVADGFSPDGTTRSGGAAEDYLVDPTVSANLAVITRDAARARTNNPRVNAVLTPAPTITVSASHDATLTTIYGWNGGAFGFGAGPIYDPPSGNGPFNYSGGLPTTAAWGAVDFPSVHYQAGDYEPVIKRMETKADAIKVEFQLFVQSASQSQFRVIVDGQYVSLTPTGFSGTAFFYVVLDFTAAGGRKVRNIIIEGYQIQFGSALAVGPTATLQKPGGPVKKMYVLGDSFLVGTLTTILNSLTGVLADYLGIKNVWNGGVPGTGYLATTPPAFTGRQRIPDIVDCAPDLLLILLGYNDVSLSVTALQAEVALTLRTIRAQPVLANMPIICCPFGGSHATALSGPTEAAIQAGVADARVPFSYFIPTVNGPNGPWMTGTGNTGAPAGNGNCDLYISTDNVHPNDAGHAYLAARLYDEITRLAG
jgi:lysophospholipase L1-like esterase